MLDVLWYSKNKPQGVLFESQILFSPLQVLHLEFLFQLPHFVIGLNMLRRSTRTVRFFVFTVNTNLSTQGNQGVLSVNASAVPNNRLMAPGPSVALQTPALPVTRPYISAINEADCSWCTQMKRMEEDELINASIKCIFSSGDSEDILYTLIFKASDQRLGNSFCHFDWNFCYLPSLFAVLVFPYNTA